MSIWTLNLFLQTNIFFWFVGKIRTCVEECRSYHIPKDFTTLFDVYDTTISRKARVLDLFYEKKLKKFKSPRILTHFFTNTFSLGNRGFKLSSIMKEFKGKKIRDTGPFLKRFKGEKLVTLAIYAFLSGFRFCCRYAVQCRLRRQQYKDNLEMQVFKGTVHSFYAPI